MDQDCAKNGLPGDGRQYRPPNGLDDDVVAELGKAKADYFGNVLVRLALEPPPSDHEDVQEELLALAEMHATQRAQALNDIFTERYHFYRVFERVLGIDKLGDEEKRWTHRLQIAICSVAAFWVMREKVKFNRPRPVQLRPDLNPPFCPGHAAYPSGHASEANACALALIEAVDKYPKLHLPLSTAAADIARRREIAGVHYRSDSACGAIVAQQLISALRADPQKLYERMVGKVRDELAGIYGRQ
jgi:acid phosphatase (class A)